MKLDDIELIKREDQDGAVKEIRSVRSLSVYGKRSIVELSIPGSTGNVFQDMGRNALMISFDGELVGPNADATLQDLKEKFELKESIPFSSDISLISDITDVVIERLSVRYVGGLDLVVHYSMTLREQKSSSTSGKNETKETPPPSQKENSKKEVEKKIDQEYEKIQKRS